jgi:hypothetical protein
MIDHDPPPTNHGTKGRADRTAAEKRARAPVVNSPLRRSFMRDSRR